jgi:hypothetical protein
MDKDKLKQQVYELQQMLAVTGQSDESRNKKTILYDLVTINMLIINLINKANLLNIDLQKTGITDSKSDGSFFQTTNIPVLPLFHVNLSALKGILDVCSDTELYPAIIIEQLKFL